MKPRLSPAEKLFHKYHDKVFGFFIDFLNNRELSRDLTQDIFVKLLQKESKIHSVADIDGYIYQMCRNLAFDHLKKAAHDKTYREFILGTGNSLQASITPAIFNKINEEHYRELLEQSLQKLPEQQRVIFNLSKKEGLSYKRIAIILDISPHTVRNHLYQAMKNLRSDLSLSDLEMFLGLTLAYWMI